MIQKKIPFNTRVTFILFIVFNSLVPIACQTDQNNLPKENKQNSPTSKSKNKQNQTQDQNDKEQNLAPNNTSNSIKIDESNAVNSAANDADFGDENDTVINRTPGATTAEIKPP